MKSLPEVLSYVLSKYKLNLKNPLTKKTNNSNKKKLSGTPSNISDRVFLQK